MDNIEQQFERFENSDQDINQSKKGKSKYVIYDDLLGPCKELTYLKKKKNVLRDIILVFIIHLKICVIF